ncbi:MAG: hypothetical protein II702_02865, partial [Clostridia bacterium]|nr:hypothetical protein [Clostridia bacterium]
CPECGTILSLFSQAANINDWINPSLGENTCERCGHKWAADDFTYTIIPYCTGARENVDFADCNEDNCSQKIGEAVELLALNEQYQKDFTDFRNKEFVKYADENTVDIWQMIIEWFKSLFSLLFK